MSALFYLVDNIHQITKLLCCNSAFTTLRSCCLRGLADFGLSLFGKDNCPVTVGLEVDTDVELQSFVVQMLDSRRHTGYGNVLKEQKRVGVFINLVLASKF